MPFKRANCQKSQNSGMCFNSQGGRHKFPDASWVWLDSAIFTFDLDWGGSPLELCPHRFHDFRKLHIALQTVTAAALNSDFWARQSCSCKMSQSHGFWKQARFASDRTPFPAFQIQAQGICHSGDGTLFSELKDSTEHLLSDPPGQVALHCMPEAGSKVHHTSN